MRRTYLTKLKIWKERINRKPLVLKGVRQVGKTYLLKEFGKRHFPAVHYINFEKEEKAHKVFEEDLDPVRIIQELELYLEHTINISEDLVIFDEIQSCPRALTSLKYFQEDMSQLALASAGSLLGIYLVPVSFPVGKVDMLTLYPMSFDEFLIALGETRTVEFLHTLKLGMKIPEILHERLWRLLKIYFIIGGLPEVVSIFCTFKSSLQAAFDEVRKKQKELLEGYFADIAKHSGKVNAMHIERVFRAIHTQLGQTQDGSSARFSFKGVIPGVSRYSRLVGAIDWLQTCGLVLKTSIVESAQIPLTAYTKENRFKLFIFDVGILGAMSNLSPKVIYDYEYGSFKGYFAENFVAQEFLYSGVENLICWHEKTAEVEFLREIDGTIIPVEVKSGWVTKAKSLRVFQEKYRPPLRITLSAKNLAINDEESLHRCPIYLASSIPLGFPK